MTSTELGLLGVAIVLALNAAFLVMLEAALRPLTLPRAEEMAEQGLPGAKRLIDIAQDPAPAVNATLFTRLLNEMAATIIATALVFQYFHELWLQLLVAISIMTMVSFILWGVAPRTLGRQHSRVLARRLSWLIRILATVLGPLTQLLILIGNAITPGRGYVDGPFASEAELRALVDQAEASDVIEEGERKMIHSVFELGDSIIKEVMVPRTDMVVIERDKTLRQAVSLALRSGFSRIPVTGKDIDDIVGILYLKDVIRRVYDNNDSQTSELVQSVMRPVQWTPDSKPVDEMLQEMQRSRTHLVMVVDEFGGTAGLVTIEDILEEIVGEIVDEYDDEIAPITTLADDRYRVSSRLPIDELGDLFGMDVDDDDVDSVGGLLAKELGMVPIAGSVIQWNGLELTAERPTGRRNNQRTILVTRAGAPDPTDAATALAAESANRVS